ncbi:MAG TPA: ATP-binding protein, partial [Acidimicrobiales bacterium]|nr:ATP-binding protein [Acidimicrobiales bacterium]
PADAIARAVFRGSKPFDDAALLVVQFSSVETAALDFDETLLLRTWRFHSSDAQTARASRLELASYLRRLAHDDGGLFEAELVLGEILANTVEHAPGLVQIDVDWRGDKPLVTVLDMGPGLESIEPSLPDDIFDENGRGMYLIGSLAEAVEVRKTGNGTRISVVLPVVRASR